MFLQSPDDFYIIFYNTFLKSKIFSNFRKILLICLEILREMFDCFIYFFQKSSIFLELLHNNHNFY